MYHPFSVAETIKTAWNVLKRNFVPLVVYSVISLFIYEFVDFLKAFILIDDDIVSRLIIILLQMLVQAYIGLSFYKLILTLMDRAYYEFEFKDIIPSFKMAFNFIVIGLLLGVLFLLLFFLYVAAERYLGYPRVFEILELLFVLYIGLRCIFCICFIVDDASSPWESLKQSFEITKDNFFKTLSIFIIIIAILALALIPVIAVMHFFWA